MFWGEVSTHGHRGQAIETIPTAEASMQAASFGDLDSNAVHPSGALSVVITEQDSTP